jgi:outer membrane protein assembly factor BamD (BamD/ComL family)
MPSPLFRSASFILTAAFLSFLAARLCRGQGKADTEAGLEELSSQAQAAQQSGDYASAAKCYQELTQLRPDVAEIWANLGLSTALANARVAEKTPREPWP